MQFKRWIILYALAVLPVTLCVVCADQQPTAVTPTAVFPRLPPIGLATACRVVRVIDGDTVEVEITRSCHVRMLQCWAPESRTTDKVEKARGMDSKEHLRDLIAEEDQGTLFVPLQTDLTEAMTLGRVLGYIWRKGDSKSLSQMQVDGGFATAAKSNVASK